jgi:hypothetical protein
MSRPAFFTALACMVLLCVGATDALAQSKKSIKKNNVRSVSIVDLENGKTLNSHRALYNKDGEVLEESDYDKEGNLKWVKKYKYNSEGDVTEEEENDIKNNTVEKHIYKYNSLGEKTEEQVWDGSGKVLRTHYYSYDGRGLKTERKTVDATGKTVSVKRYNYTFK